VEVFAVWPAQEYAALCATGDWKGYLRQPISLDSFVQEKIRNAIARISDAFLQGDHSVARPSTAGPHDRAEAD
jgi:hypothetical protein